MDFRYSNMKGGEYGAASASLAGLRSATAALPTGDDSSFQKAKLVDTNSKALERYILVTDRSWGGHGLGLCRALIEVIATGCGTSSKLPTFAASTE